MTIPTKVTISVEQSPTHVYVSTAGGRSGRQLSATAIRREPLVVTRRNTAEAKAAFGELVEKMLDTHSAPEVMSFGGFVGICYQIIGLDRVDWSYRIVRPDGSSGGEMGGADSMAEAARRCKVHLSQHATDYHDDASVMRAWRFLELDQRHDHLRYAACQRAYRQGHDIEHVKDPHQWAGDHQSVFLPALEALAHSSVRHEHSRSLDEPETSTPPTPATAAALRAATPSRPADPI